MYAAPNASTSSTDAGDQPASQGEASSGITLKSLARQPPQHAQCHMQHSARVNNAPWLKDFENMQHPLACPGIVWHGALSLEGLRRAWWEQSWHLAC